MNTYNVVVTVSTTVCIDAESPDDAIEKVSQAGNTYRQLRYPETIQKMVLEYFVGPREDGMPILN